MNIEVDIEGNTRTYTDETPIKEIRGLNSYFLKEVFYPDHVDTFGLSKALLLHKDATLEDLMDVLECWYPKEDDSTYVLRIKDLLDIAEALYFRLKDSLKEQDFWFFLRRCYSYDLIPNVQKDALQTLLSRGVDNLDIETLIHLHPDIPADVVIQKTYFKKMDEYDFYLETLKRLYRFCINYAKEGSWDVAQQFFGILSKTTGFKKTTEGHGDFSLTTKAVYRSSMQQAFGFPDHEPTIISYNDPDGSPTELASEYWLV